MQTGLSLGQRVWARIPEAGRKTLPSAAAGVLVVTVAASSFTAGKAAKKPCALSKARAGSHFSCFLRSLPQALAVPSRLDDVAFLQRELLLLLEERRSLQARCLAAELAQRTAETALQAAEAKASAAEKRKK